MSKPRNQREDTNLELDLDAETVRDLEPRDVEAEEVKGGSVVNCCTLFNVGSCIKTN